MNIGVKKLSTAVRLALSLGAVIAVGASSTAFAQDAAAPAAEQQAQTLKAVVVTGSRLPSVTITASSPVTTIDAQALTVTGTTSVDQLVNQLPQLSGISVDARLITPLDPLGRGEHRPRR